MTVEINKKHDKEQKLKQFVQQADQLSEETENQQTEGPQTETHVQLSELTTTGNSSTDDSSNSTQKLVELNSEVCEFLDDYKDTDPKVLKACESKQLPESSEHLHAVLDKINDDFKKCSHSKLCLGKLEQEQKDHFKSVA